MKKYLVLLAAMLSATAGAADLTGAGATFPYPIYSKWAEAYKVATGIGLNYQSIGSGGGIKQIKAKTVDFGASDMPLKPEDLEKEGLMQFPAIIGGVVPVVNLEGIAPAMRGTPQIEVTLDIDANGIMHVSAKDKNTGKENKITIKSDSGLSKEEIERMVQEAEANAEEDKKQRELIETRNMADAQIHSIRKDMKDVESSISQEEKDKIETAIKELDDAVISGDKETVTQKLSDLLAATEPIRKAKEQKDKDKAEGVMDAEVTEVV